MTLTRDTAATSTCGLERPAARHRVILSSLLSYPVAPLFVACDVVAVALSCIGTGSGVAVVGFLAIILPLNAAAGLYRSKLSLSVCDDFTRLIGHALVAGAVLTCLSSWFRYFPGWSPRSLLVLSLAAVPVRACAYCGVRFARRRKYVRHRTLILGAGKVGRELADILDEHTEYGLTPVGFLDNEPAAVAATGSLPVLGAVEELGETVGACDVNDVIVAFNGERDDRLVEITRTCDRLNCEIFVVPRLFERHPARCGHAETVWSMPLVRLRRAPHRTVAWRFKRLADITLALASLVLLAPLMAVCALAVRLETGRGFLFRQTRVGSGGRSFELLKFRSLKPADDAESATRWTIATDGRVGRVGRLLRRTSVDELPQLWNVLRGDMSLVGPRPERPYFAARFASLYPEYSARHRVPPGLTGWAQIHGLRGDTSIFDRARFDNHYIENWSLALDVRIVFQTLLALVKAGRRRA